MTDEWARDEQGRIFNQTTAAANETFAKRLAEAEAAARARTLTTAVLPRRVPTLASIPEKDWRRYRGTFAGDFELFYIDQEGPELQAYADDIAAGRIAALPADESPESVARIRAEQQRVFDEAMSRMEQERQDEQEKARASAKAELEAQQQRELERRFPKPVSEKESTAAILRELGAA